MATHMEQRRDLAATWTSVNPVLYPGEIGYEADTGKFKIGDGTTVWNSLAYIGGLSGFSGYSGYSGRSGYSGYSGNGISGYSGYSGATGTSGYSGYSGASGYSGYSGSAAAIQCKYVTVNQSTSSNTSLTNITDLVFAVGGSETWVFQVNLNLGNNVDVTGLKFGLTRPTGASSAMTLLLYARDGSVTTVYGGTGATSCTWTVGSGNIPAAFSTCTGTVVVTTAGTSGNVQFQFAQETSDPTNLTVTIRSAIMAMKVA